VLLLSPFFVLMLFVSCVVRIVVVGAGVGVGFAKWRNNTRCNNKVDMAPAQTELALVPAPQPTLTPEVLLLSRLFVF